MVHNWQLWKEKKIHLFNHHHPMMIAWTAAVGKKTLVANQSATFLAPFPRTAKIVFLWAFKKNSIVFFTFFDMHNAYHKIQKSLKRQWVSQSVLMLEFKRMFLIKELKLWFLRKNTLKNINIQKKYREKFSRF